MWIDESLGGKAKITEDDYLQGTPELVVEVAASSAAFADWTRATFLSLLSSSSIGFATMLALATIQASDGSIHVTYSEFMTEAGKELTSIRHVQFDEAPVTIQRLGLDG